MPHQNNKPRFTQLNDWLKWQESLHPIAIDLKLERIAEVAKRVGCLTPSCPIITVAGTNGKGSTVNLLSAILLAEGYRVGAYTSPHILRYNERIRINNQPVSDQAICHSFAAIDAARKELSLTYFEFSTLAAMHQFMLSKVDVIILEVGLGGRLDAVNLWDCSAAIVTNIAIDHVNWLGDTRDLIGREKAGVLRTGCPAIYGEVSIPASVVDYAQSIDAHLIRLGNEFSYEILDLDNNPWNWSGLGVTYKQLPKPSLMGVIQYQNAANVLACLNSINHLLIVSEGAIRQGLIQANLSGRLEKVHDSPDIIVDVAHNPHACETLSQWLHSNPIKGKTIALFSVLADKDLTSIAKIMSEHFDQWHIVPLDDERAIHPLEIKHQLLQAGIKSSIVLHKNIKKALQEAEKAIKYDDRIIAFGSFLLVSLIKRADLNR